MKQSLLLVAAMFGIATTLPAQNIVDATRLGSSGIYGTARYNAMAGAFGALGGDLTCMNDNPAGMAIFRNSSMFTITPHLSFSDTSSKGTEKVSNSDNHFAVSNLGAVFAFRNSDEDGSWVNFNLGIGLNRTYENYSRLNVINDGTRNTFSQYITSRANDHLKRLNKPDISDVFDWDNRFSTAPYLTLLGASAAVFDKDESNRYRVVNHFDGMQGYQALYMRESTRTDQYNISASVNYGDQFYVGATLVITDFNSTISTEMDEHYDYELEGSYLSYDNRIESKGSGIGLNLGVMWSPIDNLRVGAAIHTPVWNTVDDEFFEGNMLTYDEFEDINYGWEHYSDGWSYRITTPWEYQVSAAYIFGTSGLISVEYDLRDFSTMHYSNNPSDNYQFDFGDYNQRIKDYMQMQHTIKVGGEYRVTDRLSARLGYAIVTSPYKDEALNANIPTEEQNAAYNSTTKTNFTTTGKQNYYTGGLGWRGDSWFADFSFTWHKVATKVAFNPSDAYKNPISYENPVACDLFDVDHTNKNFDLTIGYRF